MSWMQILVALWLAVAAVAFVFGCILFADGGAELRPRGRAIVVTVVGWAALSWPAALAALASVGLVLLATLKRRPAR